MKKVHHTLEKVGQCQFLFWLTIYMFGSMETKAQARIAFLCPNLELKTINCWVFRVKVCFITVVCHIWYGYQDSVARGPTPPSEILKNFIS